MENTINMHKFTVRESESTFTAIVTAHAPIHQYELQNSKRDLSIKRDFALAVSRCVAELTNHRKQVAVRLFASLSPLNVEEYVMLMFMFKHMCSELYMNLLLLLLSFILLCAFTDNKKFLHYVNTMCNNAMTLAANCEVQTRN